MAIYTSVQTEADPYRFWLTPFSTRVERQL